MDELEMAITLPARLNALTTATRGIERLNKRLSGAYDKLDQGMSLDTEEQSLVSLVDTMAVASFCKTTITVVSGR